MGYCAECGGTGLKIDNTPCSCKLNKDYLFNGLVCLDVPEQYQGATFNSNLIADDMGDIYRKFMQDTYESLTSMRMKYHNMVICSPPAKAKTIMAYCVIQTLFRKGVETFPVYDVLEIKRIMGDMDYNRKQLYDTKDPQKLLTAPYIFVKIPNSLSSEVYETISTLMDRRVRRGTSTIFLFNGTWETLTNYDSRNILKSLLGDGAYCTIENKTWRPIK